MTKYTLKARRCVEQRTTIEFEARDNLEAAAMARRLLEDADWETVSAARPKLEGLWPHDYAEAWFAALYPTPAEDGGIDTDAYYIRRTPWGTIEHHYSLPDGVDLVGSIFLGRVGSPEVEPAVRNWLDKRNMTVSHLLTED